MNTAAARLTRSARPGGVAGAMLASRSGATCGAFGVRRNCWCCMLSPFVKNEDKLAC